MNIFSRSKISHKLGALMVGLALGFILIGAAHFIQLSAEARLDKKRNSIVQYSQLAAQANVEQLKMRGMARGYVSTNTESEHQLYLQEKESAQIYVARLNADIVHEDINDVVDKITKTVDQYQHYFSLYYMQSLLFNSKNADGVQQKLIAIGEKFEENIVLIEDNSKYKSVAGVFNLIRHHEKDYIATRGRSHSLRVLEAFGRLNDVIDNLTVRASTKLLLSETAKNHKALFEKLVFSIDKITESARQISMTGKKLDEEFLMLQNGLSKIQNTMALQVIESSNLYTAIFIGILFSVASCVAMGMFFVYKSIVFPLVHMQNIIGRVNSGNLQARVGLLSGGELGDLGRVFNRLLDERIQGLEVESKQNEVLNNSIIILIRSLSEIAKLDLTVKVPVSTDITGTISDAVNLLTTETAKTLQRVKEISQNVLTASQLLDKQTDDVVQVADGERAHVVELSQALEHSSQTMSGVAKDAETASEIASDAIGNTQRALRAVTETVVGIKNIRSTISETEKRIKRLGERSQEINGIVNLINTIAERTHILALNASMHAASAGEAGRGFAVVAHEVQRLAENARDATSEISLMVKNIHSETSDTVTIINRLITQVADGTILAERAGLQMTATESTTKQLVESVMHISDASIKQAKFTNEINTRSGLIMKSTELARDKLLVQKQQSKVMDQYAHDLVAQVNVFTLPGEMPAIDFDSCMDIDADLLEQER